MGKSFGRTLRRLRAFFGNERANVAMIFGLSLLPLTLAAGAGLDMTRAMIVKSNLTEAVDAAALAVASTSTHTTMSQTDMNLEAKQYFWANYTLNTTAYGAPPTQPTVTPATQSVTVTSSVNVPTTLMRIATELGVTKWPYVTVNASSTVVWGQTKLWVSLVLDNTGSMCQSDSNPNAGSPCPSPTSDSKIVALKTATHQLLTMLQNASANAGDVQVAIIPFTLTVNAGTSNAGAAWIDWTDWEAQPPSGAPSTSVGPGSTCPWTNSSNGYKCTSGSANGSGNVSTIPSSGLICPSVHNTNAGNGLGGHYYNGCYNSVATQTKTTTTDVSTPITTKQNCSQTGSGPITCTNKSGYPSTGSSTTNSSSTTTSGYTGDSTTTSNSSSSTTSDGSKSCTGSGANRHCTWTRTIVETDIAETVAKTGAGPWNHTWVVNSHSTWNGCIMDRAQDYDTQDTLPSSTATDFPAENTQNCVGTTLTSLGYSWSTLSSEVDSMVAGGTTNQTVGLAWGWQAMTAGDPLNPPTLPANTSRFIILVSDGLNTQDRWSGDGTNEDSTTDARMALACTNAKADGIVIYTVFIDLNGTQGNSTVLQNCASDSTKYFDLTSSGAVITTLNQIGQQITNLRVSQ